MSEHESDDRPWTEEQWERFMQAADVRSAKFGELLETLIDHPDRDAIIAREMGWDRPESESGETDASWRDEDASPPYEDLEDAVGADFDEKEFAEAERRKQEALESIEAFAAGYAWSLQVHDALKPLLDLEEDPELDEDLNRALAGFQIAAKIAGGHGMGYEDEVLGGNIVCCKQSLAAADEALEGLDALRSHNAAAGIALDELITEGQRVRRLVAEWIEELRSRVWWG